MLYRFKAAGAVLMLSLMLSACPSEQVEDRNDNNDVQLKDTELSNTTRQTTTQAPATERAIPALSTDPAGFLTRARQGGSTEVQLGRLALAKSANAEVKRFAQHLIRDHTQAGKEVDSLAKTKQISLPSQIAPEQQSLLSELSGLSGAAFDQAFIAQNVRIHELVVQDFQTQASDNQDADAKALAAKTLPQLQAHLSMARELEARLK